jgi:hypothetical protein
MTSWIVLTTWAQLLDAAKSSSVVVVCLGEKNYAEKMVSVDTALGGMRLLDGRAAHSAVRHADHGSCFFLSSAG